MENNNGYDIINRMETDKMNEHIKNYCYEYIESDNSPQFSVFLKGEWGCGKTYFINKIIEKYSEPNQKIKKNEIMYLSLFGVGQTSEIDGLIYQKSHPVLSSQGLKIASGVLHTILKYKNICIDRDDYFTKKKLKRIKELEKKLIIIDDIERTSLSPSQIFGYFSEYLNQFGTKIIFIGNEEHIVSEQDAEKSKYNMIKEKTIGIEFLIEPDIESAIERFITELALTDEKYHYITKNCRRAMSILGCNNLRTVRQCLYNLKLLIESIEEDAMAKHGENISKIFINLFIQKGLGFILKKEEVHEAIVGYEKHNLNYPKYKEQKDINKTDFSFDQIGLYIPLNTCWGEIIFNGNYSKDILSKEYQNEKDANSSKKMKGLFLLIDDWRNMDKGKFEQIYKETNSEFQSGKYLHPGEILLYLNYMLIFSIWELLDDKRENIKLLVETTVEKYKDKIYPVDDWGMLEFSYAGWRYSDGFPEMDEMKSSLKRITEGNRQSYAQKEIEKDIDNIKGHIDEFCQRLMHINGVNKYYNIPFLHLVNIQKFIDIFISLNASEQSSIVMALEERYGKEHTNGESLKRMYIQDKDNLKELSKQYNASLGEIKYNPQELLKKDVSKRLLELIEYFETCL